MAWLTGTGWTWLLEMKSRGTGEPQAAAKRPWRGDDAESVAEEFGRVRYRAYRGRR